MTIPRRGLRLVLGAGVLLALVAACAGEPPVPPPSVPTTAGSTVTPPPTTGGPGTPVPSPGAPSYRQDDEGRLSRVLATGLDVPWDFVRLPDGSVLLTLRDRAELVRLETGQEPRLVQRVDGVVPGGEGGLLGLALSPAFATDSLVYLYGTTAGDNRVVRYRYSPDGLADPVVILQGIPKAGNHNGGRLRFGPDGMLYIGTGDAGDTSTSQNEDSLAGKILRVTPEGKVPAGNPFGNEVWSYGHRNVQGLGWDADGRMFASEFGQNSYDELNLITPGANYGWPIVEGSSDREGFTEPLLVWTTDQASPSGIAVSPSGQVFIAALRGERVWTTQWQEGGTSRPEVFFDGLGRVRAVEIVDGELWMLTNNTFRSDPGPDDDMLVATPL